MSEKLPVFATLGAAFRCARKYSWRILPYMVGVLVTWIAVGIGAFLIGTTFFIYQNGIPTPRNVINSFVPYIPFIVFLVEIGLFAVLLPVITSFQRLVLQGSDARVGFAYRREEWLVVVAVLKLLLVHFLGIICLSVVFVLLVALATAIKDFWLAALVGVPLFFVYLIAFSRLVLMLPAAAVGDRLSLRAAYRLTKGSLLRYLATLILAMIITTAPQLIVMLILVPMPAVPPDMITGILPNRPVFMSIILFAVFIALYYFGVIMMAAVWAQIYRRLSSGSIKPESPLFVDEGALPDPVI